MLINEKGQATIYIIVAIAIVALISAVFFIMGGRSEGANTEFSPIYDSYLSCISEFTREAIDIAGTQGGRIYLDKYEPGSEYSPFSNHLNFFGIPVAYWYYQSANGVITENVPTKEEIEKDIARYIEERISSCDFSEFYAQGFGISFGEINTKTKVMNDKVSVIVESDMVITKNDSNSRKTSHEVNVESEFGKFLALAGEIYNYEKDSAFLENYSVDVLRNYAPVDGVEISCTPKIWKTRDVNEELLSALEANIAAIKFNGGDYTLNDPLDKYFIVDLEVDENVNLIYNKEWSTKVAIEGEGVDQELMIAEPVGTQAGLGAMGFCYAPYHFIYDISYPVLVQISSDEEIFQFPIVVIVDKNMPRKAELSTIDLYSEYEDICTYKNSEAEINLYDSELNKIDGEVSFSCLSQECDLGRTSAGNLKTNVPICYNGFLNVKVEGYAEKRQLFSSNEENYADIVLDKEKNVKVNLEIDGKEFISGTAIVTFSEINGTRVKSAVFPETKEVTLSEGYYEVTVYAYSNSSIIIPASKKTQCTEVSAGGLAGIFGSTKEQCFDIDVAETKIEQALIGGGKTSHYIFAEQLESGELTIAIESLPRPSTIDELSNNFILFENREVGLEYA